MKYFNSEYDAIAYANSIPHAEAGFGLVNKGVNTWSYKARLNTTQRDHNVLIVWDNGEWYGLFQTSDGTWCNLMSITRVDVGATTMRRKEIFEYLSDQASEFVKRYGMSVDETITVEFQVYATGEPEYFGSVAWEIRTPAFAKGRAASIYGGMHKVGEILREQGYTFEFTGLSYLDSGWFKGKATKSTDPTLLFSIGGVALKDMYANIDLQAALNRSGTFVPPSDNWRVQRYWDVDLDETIAVHNGERWVTAYKRASGWNVGGLVSGRMVTQEPVDTADYLKSKEPN